MATKMTEQDLVDCLPIAEAIVATVATDTVRPPCAVAAVARALAAVAILAEGGEDAAIGLYKHFYKELSRRGKLS